MERAKRSCSADSWHALLVAMNKPEDEVSVEAGALVEVLQCHQRKAGRVSRDLIIKEGRARCTVRRALLWDLVQEHGKICEEQ